MVFSVFLFCCLRRQAVCGRVAGKASVLGITDTRIGNRWVQPINNRKGFWMFFLTINFENYLSSKIL